jgi:hypothetical protein
LQIIGIKSPEKTDGRILSEAMTDASAAEPNVETKTIEATKDFSAGHWRQSLKISRVGSTIYLDDGNGQFSAKQRPAVSKPPN